MARVFVLKLSGYDSRGENAPYFLTESSLLLKQISFGKYISPPSPLAVTADFCNTVLYCAPHTTAVAVVSRCPEPAAEPPGGIRACRCPHTPQGPAPAHTAGQVPGSGGRTRVRRRAGRFARFRQELPAHWEGVERCLPRSSCGRGRSRAPLC